MSLGAIVFVALAAVVSLLVLLWYAPIRSTFFGRIYSPRLLFARIVAPFDIGVTLILILGTVVGLTVVTGIGNIVFNVATGFGISLGSILVRKIFIPLWKHQYKAACLKE